MQLSEFILLFVYLLTIYVSIQEGGFMFCVIIT